MTVYIFHEPSMLSSLQESGLTGVVLKSLIMKDVSVCYFLYSAFNDQDGHVYAIRSSYIQYFIST